MTYYHICRARTVDLKIKMDQKMNFKLLCLVKSVRMVITAPTDLTVRNTKKAYLIETSYTATRGAMLKKNFLFKTIFLLRLYIFQHEIPLLKLLISIGY